MSRDEIIQKFQKALSQDQYDICGWNIYYEEDQLHAQHRDSKTIYTVTPHIDGVTWCWCDNYNFYYKGFDFSTPHRIDGPSQNGPAATTYYHLDGKSISKEDYWNHADVIAFSKLKDLNEKDKKSVIGILNV